MSDELPFYAPNKPPAAAREAKPGEELWTFVRGTDRRRAELRDYGPFGVEFQLSVNDEFVSGHHFPNRALAVLAAEAVREAYEKDRWTCSRCAGEHWICEPHPDQPDRHESCTGPGVPCPACNTSDPPRPPRGFVSYVK